MNHSSHACKMILASALADGSALDFERHLTEHARTEEAVMYPAAILVGKFVRLRLGQAA